MSVDVIASITGHRPERIPNMQLVRKQLENAYIDLNVKHVIQGQAPGVDLNSAIVAYDMRIPYTCAIPWAGHAPRKDDAATYGWVLDYASLIIYVNDCEGYPGPQVYQERNEWMVDHGNVVIAVWDGVKKGGTWNCVKYALKMNVPIWRINPEDGSSGWYDKTV